MIDAIHLFNKKLAAIGDEIDILTVGRLPSSILARMGRCTVGACRMRFSLVVDGIRRMSQSID
jgi:hypothetical protein